MLLREIGIENLNEPDYNPRIKLDENNPEYQKVKRSIEMFGDVEPIVWNKRTFNVVGGNMRLSVLRSMGYESVLCSVVDLPIEKEQLLNVALNKIKGDWDKDKLTEVLTSFDNMDTMTLTGFTAEDLEVLTAPAEDLSEYFEPYVPKKEREENAEAQTVKNGENKGVEGREGTGGYKYTPAQTTAQNGGESEYTAYSGYSAYSGGNEEAGDTGEDAEEDGEGAEPYRPAAEAVPKNFVVCLSFTDAEQAKRWAKSLGVEVEIDNSKFSQVVVMA